MAPLIERLKREWRRLRSDPPGERFEGRYQRRRQQNESPIRRAAMVAIGVVILAAGIFFLPAPGPGMLIVALGAGVIAQESRHMARALDWTEVRLRRLLAAGRRLYRDASPLGRVLLVLLALLVVGAAGYGVYRLVFPG